MDGANKSRRPDQWIKTVAAGATGARQAVWQESGDGGMAGTLFEYFDGYVRVEFARAGCGDIFIDFSLYGDATATTPCDDDLRKGEPEIIVQMDVSIRTWTSSTVSYFFADLVRWLEAVVCGVRECAFDWEGAGPDGELRWHYNGRDGGMFMLDWSGTSRSAGGKHRLRVNRAQMVRAFYESFRSFVESVRYDPLDYERLEAGETFALILEGADLQMLADHMAPMRREQAELLVHEMLDLAYDRDAGYPRRATLDELTRRALQREGDPDRSHRWLAEEWDSWGLDQRRDHLVETVWTFGTGIGFGEKLRELRSPMIERWLAEHAEGAPAEHET